MPYENLVIKKPYYDIDKFGSYVNYKSVERKKKIKKSLDKILAVFDICLIVLALVLIFNLVKYTKNTISLNMSSVKINEIKNDINILKGKNQIRRDEIAKSLNLDDIKKRAIFNLDMVSPTENNTIYFNTND